KDFESLANQIADFVEDLSQVATGLPLQNDCRGEKPQVKVRHAVGHFVDRVFQRHAEVLGLIGAFEFRGDRGIHLIGDQLEAGSKTVTGSEGATDELESFGQLAAKGGQTTLAFHVQGEVRNEAHDQTSGR